MAKSATSVSPDTRAPTFHLKMLNAAFARNFTLNTVQMPLNLMDAHYDSFEKKVLPVLVKHNIGVLGMKPMGDGLILKSKAAEPVECLQYALTLPTSVVITGCDSLPILQQALKVARTFKPLSGSRSPRSSPEPRRWLKKANGSFTRPHTTLTGRTRIRSGWNSWFGFLGGLPM